MKEKREGLILMVIFVASTRVESSGYWPLQKCSRNDPQINACILKAARHAIPLLKDGIKELKIPRMDPLDAGNYTMSVRRGPVSLDLVLGSLRIHGATNFNVTAVDFDRKNLRILMEGLNNQIVADADCILSGKLFRVPINSSGHVTFTVNDFDLFHDIKFTPRTTKKKSYVEMQINNIKFKSFKNFHMDFNNPNIAQWANNALNKLVNDNYRLIFTSFSSVIEKMIQDVFTKAFTPMMSNFSYDDLLPESI